MHRMRIKASTERLEVRLHPDLKRDIQLAASLRQVAVSDYVRAAAAGRAREDLASTRSTTVPPAFFHELLAALDEPTTLEAPLARAVAEARARVARR